MKFCSISIGSSGNCIYAGSDTTSVLVDAGISGARIERGLNEIDMTTKDMDGILVTHEHSTIDYIKGSTSIGKIPTDLLHVICADMDFEIGDLRIHPFRISHDAAEPVGFRIIHDEKTCAVATDMGCFDDYTVDNLRNLDVLLLESNHDVHMLEAGRYPYYLKRRILSEHGHLSNETCGQLLGGLLHDNIRHVFLGHLSHENNYEALAYETVSQEVTNGDNPYNSKDFNITIAHRDRISESVVW